MIIKKFLSYLMFWKKGDEASSTSINLKMMHGINRISIFMFLMALIFLFIKFVILS